MLIDLTTSEVDEILKKRDKEAYLDENIHYGGLLDSVDNPTLKTVLASARDAGREVSITSNYGNDLVFTIHPPSVSKYETLEEMDDAIHAEGEEWKRRIQEELFSGQ